MKPSSKNRPATRQTGYALILMVVTLMGIGGAVIIGFTQGAKQETEQERYLHNQRILEEAKQALLQYAYNYPEIALAFNDSVRGPGRLPCPDNDISGEAGFGKPDPHVTDYCVFPDDRPGRFPWDANGMQFYEARDASGEHLWYAVSDNFNNFDSNNEINSSTQGTITIRDQGGQLLYDGATAGVAAVIIAPGPPIERDGTLQVRGTDAEMKDATNYLDLFGALDNAEFIDADSSNGFVPGPIDDSGADDLIVNDQLIIVTAAEVIAMAEKATLQAYRKAINDYLAATGDVYPWLYNYDGIEYDSGGGESVDVAIDKLSSFFPGDAVFATEKATYLGIDTSGNNDGIFGRIPSMFAEYFTETDSQPIETQLSGSITLSASALTILSGVGGFPGSGDQNFNDGPALPFETTQILSDVKFVDLADSGEGRLTTTFPALEPALNYEVYFWDEDNATQQGWTTCPGGADQLSDCVGVSGHGKARILHMTVTLKFEDPSGIENFDLDYTPAPAIVVMPATATAHASITATYAASEVISFAGIITATYEFEQHFHYSTGDSTTILNSADGSYATGTVDMTFFPLGPLSLGIRYYPKLPTWAFQDDWHNSIRMAYALEYEPPGTGPCIVDTTCLQLGDSPGTPKDKISLLVIAGQHDWTDVDLNDKLRNDVVTVFDAGNENNNPTFYRHRGNDKILVIEEL